MKQEIILTKGWNLVSFQFKVDINLLKLNKNILEIKSIDKTYNSSVLDIFNNLIQIEINKGYYIKSKNNDKIIIEGDYEGKVSYQLNKGWNFIGYPFDFKYDFTLLDNKISEVKNKSKNYNRDLVNFNTLNSFDEPSAFWVYSQEIVNFEIKNINLVEEYDIVIVGAGPAGCMISKVLSESDKFKNKKIVLLEKGSFHIKNEFDKKYRSVLSWSDAMNDSNNSNTKLSENNKLIWLGEGLGGGTLHFGMQYIDQPDLFQHIPEIRLYLDEVYNLTKTQRFNYDEDNSKLWKEIYDKFSKDESINFYNNRIYSDDIKKLNRFVASDLLKKLNIDIKTNADVEKIIFTKNKATEVILKNNKIIKFNKLILSSGAIGNVEILHQSNNKILQNLPIGKTMFDHAGVNLYYQPMNQNWSKYIDIGHLQIRSKNLKWQIYLSKVPNVPILVVTLAQAKKDSNIGTIDPNNKIIIEHFSDLDKPDTLVEAYEYVNSKLNELGYVNTDPRPVNNEYIINNSDSIYHYHGTCPFNKVVDKNCKIRNIDNVYIGDISVLDESVPGSTSVSSICIGYRLAKILENENIIKIEEQIISLEKENKQLVLAKEELFNTEKLKQLWEKDNKMYVVIQNDGSRIGVGDNIVYDMGNFWKGGGHPVNLTRYLESENYNFTNILRNRHGTFSFWRIEKGGAIQVGKYDDGSIDIKIDNNLKSIEELKQKLL